MAPTPQLKPLVAPGISLFPNLTAQKQETLIMKETGEHFTRSSWDVTLQGPNSGGQGSTLMTIDETKSHHYVLVNSTGQQLCQIDRKTKMFAPTIYRSTSGNTVLWELEITSHTFHSPDYDKRDIDLVTGPAADFSIALMVMPGTKTAIPMTLEKKIQGQDNGVMLNGLAVATIHEDSWHLRREEHINVAAGMDIGLVVGLAVAHFDRQRQERSNAAAGASGGGGGGGC